MKLCLNINNVTVRYSESPVIINNLSLNIVEGERVALLGLNGSGKTTLLHTLAGLISFEGEISIVGFTLVKKNINIIRDNIGFLFSIPEDQILFPKIIDDTAFKLIRRGISKENAYKQTNKILELLNISHISESSPYHISHGQRQRVALAGTMIGEPKLLLLDEPSATLDPPGKESLCELLNSFNTTILLATHDIEFASKTCQRFIVLHQGRIIQDCDNAKLVLKYWENFN